MTLQTEGAHVGQVAFASAFGDGEDVIGIPEVAAASPLAFELAASVVVELALVFTEDFGIEAAQRADAAIAGKDLIAEIAGIGAEAPFADAGFRAEREAALGDF